MRSVLNTIYSISGAIAGISLFVLFAILLLQISVRVLGIVIPSLSAYATYAMSICYFFGLGYTFHHDSHVRVSLLTNSLGENRQIVENIALSVSAFIVSWWAFFCIKNTYLSYVTNDVSQSQDATHLWIPQTAMIFGSVIFVIAIFDRLISNIKNGKTLKNENGGPDRAEGKY